MELFNIIDVDGKSHLINADAIISIDSGSCIGKMNQWQFLLTLRERDPIEIGWDEVKSLAFYYNPYMELKKTYSKDLQEANQKAREEVIRNLFTWANSLSEETLGLLPRTEWEVTGEVVEEARGLIGMEADITEKYANVYSKVKNCREIASDVYDMLDDVRERLSENEWLDFGEYPGFKLLRLLERYLPQKKLPDNFRQYVAEFIKTNKQTTF